MAQGPVFKRGIASTSVCLGYGVTAVTVVVVVVVVVSVGRP